MRPHLVLVTAMLLGLVAGATAQKIPSGLVGTWELVSRVDRDPNGNIVIDPGLGAEPIGYLIYDSRGHVFAQLMARNRTGSPCVTTSASNINNVGIIGGYDSYFGTAEVDRKAGTVTHILAGAITPGDVGRSITRRFSLDGNKLTIQFEPGGQDNKKITRTLIWRRADK